MPAGTLYPPEVVGFCALPRRLYLDTSVLQTVHTFGDSIFDGLASDDTDVSPASPQLIEDIEALRRILTVNQRASFEFVVTAANLDEVAERRHPDFTQWVLDVESSWRLSQSGSRQLSPAGKYARIGSISRKDWRLINDALDYACEGFLTIDRPLLTQAVVVERLTGLRLLRPYEYWLLLRPWAALYL